MSIARIRSFAFAGIEAVPIEVQVLAKDNQQREASVIFKLELGVAPAASTAVTGAVLGSTDAGFPVAHHSFDDGR